MEWQIILALAVVIPVIMLPVEITLYTLIRDALKK